MENARKWKKGAVEALSQPVKRTRGLKSVVGRVEHTFDEIKAARQRGMPWHDIAAALQNGDDVSVAAVQSAYKRIYREKDIPPRSTEAARGEPATSVPLARTHRSDSHVGLFDKPQRWVDDGE